MKTILSLLIITLSIIITKSFTINKILQKRLYHNKNSNSICHLSSIDDIVKLNLTPELEKYVTGLRNVPDDKLRYQQLLFLASKLQAMDDSLKIENNKVKGCLSTVYVHATITDNKVSYVGDSDSQLTKGLLALLINGLSGHSVDKILTVNPEFINYAGISNSLTPGRNNGFLNMLNLMKTQAQQFTNDDKSNNNTDTNNYNENKAPSTILSPLSSGNGPVFQSIVKKLTMLNPTELMIVDESHKHAGHVGIADVVNGKAENKTETHFNVKVVADCFEGLSRVQRHQMIYTLLSQELKNGVHALSITTNTPTEI